MHRIQRAKLHPASQPGRKHRVVNGSLSTRPAVCGGPEAQHPSHLRGSARTLWPPADGSREQSLCSFFFLFFQRVCARVWPLSRALFWKTGRAAKNTIKHTIVEKGSSRRTARRKNEEAVHAPTDHCSALSSRHWGTRCPKDDRALGCYVSLLLYTCRMPLTRKEPSGAQSFSRVFLISLSPSCSGRAVSARDLILRLSVYACL